MADSRNPFASASTNLPREAERRSNHRPIFSCPGMPLDEQEECLMYPTPQIRFPDLGSLMARLVGKLKNPIQSPDIEGINYPKLFFDCGIPSGGLVEMAMTMIEPEVMNFQGQTLSPELFRKAHEDQFQRTFGQPWSQIGSYADGVLDDRYPKYIRYYIGQSDRLYDRVYKDHPKYIRNSNDESLHYFTLARGYGHRSAHFLRLWHASRTISNNEEGKILPKLLQNLLEMTFCRAFESLPPIALTEYFGEGPYSDVGLNNLLPLVQGKRIAMSLLAKYLDYHKQSSDPDVVAFTKLRPKQKAAKRQARMKGSKTFSIRDYQLAMNQLLQGLGLNVDSIADLATPATCVESVNIQNELQRLTRNNERPFIAPIGNYSAKVGVVMDSEAVIDGDENSAEPLKAIRLQEDNSLLWTNSFEGLGNGPSRDDALSFRGVNINSLNYFTIMGSGLRVIVLCGLRTQNDIVLSFKRRSPFTTTSRPRPELLGPYQLPLQGASPRVWLLCHGRDVSRVLIASPESPEMSNKKYSTEHLMGFRDAFGLAAAVSGEKVKYSYWEQTCFYAAVRIQGRLEKEGSVDPLSSSSMPPLFRNWLHYKRFTDDDIKELEDKAESFTLGLLQITSIIAHKEKVKSKDPANNPLFERRGYRGENDGAKFQSVKELFERVSTRPYKNSSKDELGQNTNAEQIDEDEEIPDEQVVERMSEVITDSIEFAEQNDGMDNLLSPEFIPPLTADLKARFQAMLTRDGIKQKIADDKGWKRLILSLHLFSFSVDEDPKAPFNEKAEFAIRAELSAPGTKHPHCVLKDEQQRRHCVPDDPCLRLALQYRLLDNRDGKGPSETWYWAQKRRIMTGKGATAEERRVNEEKYVYKLNALVEFIEGKDICDIFYTPRRWMTSHDQPSKVQEYLRRLSRSSRK